MDIKAWLLTALQTILLWGLASSLPAFEFDSMRVGYGSAITPDVDADDLRLAARWHWLDLDEEGQEGWSSRVFVDLVLTRWHSKISDSSNRSLTGADTINGAFVTPVWRMQESSGEHFRPFLELGLGVGAISDTELRREGRPTPLRKSSKFQFEVLAGTGVRFGERWQYDLNVQWVHYSNGNTSMPNYSFDALQLGFGYRF